MKHARAHLIANAKSGKGQGSTLAELAQKMCDELGIELVKYEVHDCEKAVEAAKQDGGVVIAAGGDGTIRSVAQVANGTGVRFGVVACGTFNFFARTHRIPEDPAEAMRLALTGETRPVRLGVMNDQVFLINASLGLYARAIREREQRMSRWGRNRLVVIISTVISFFTHQFLLKVDLVAGGKIQTLRTPMIFIGNNALQLRDLAMDVVRCMKLDLLAVVTMKPVSKLETLRILARGVMKTLENDRCIDTFCVDELTIHTRRAWNEVALDGELMRMSTPLKIKALPQALNLVLPPKEPAK